MSVLMLVGLIFAVMGLLVGSFLTVVADRVPEGRSVVAPGSACGGCGRELGVLDLIPVLSWLALRGKCRTCGVRIGIESVLVELSTAALFVLMHIRFHNAYLAATYCILVGALVALTAIDVRLHRLPREVSYTALAIGTPMLFVAALVEHEPRRIWMAALGAALCVAVLGILHLVSRGGLGDGDVRLAPLLGAYLGWQNPGVAVMGLLLGFTLGAVVGVLMMVVGKAGRKTALPFGPFLAAGAVIALFIGQDLVDVVMAR